MERHFTYTEKLFPGAFGYELEKFLFGVLIAALIYFFGRIVAKKLSSEEKIKDKLIPGNSSKLFDIFDIFNEKFIEFHDSILGKHARRYYPMTASIFLFLTIANVTSLVPGFPAATTTIWINVSLATIVFIAFNYYGFKENGVIGYIKHCAGGDAITQSWIMIVFIGIFLACIEAVSFVIRLLTLNMRLYWNMTADHMIINVIGGMSDYWFLLIGPVLLAKGLFVSILQASVFTMLTMIYIFVATAHEEEH